MKRKSNKKLTIALLALLGVVSAGGTYAYWQGAVSSATETNTNKITIGTANDVTTEIKLNGPTANSKKLVPAGFIEDNINETESVEFAYTVTWAPKGITETEKEAQYASTLTVSVVKAVVGLEENEGDDAELKAAKADALAKVVVVVDNSSQEISLHDDDKTVKVTVSLDVPDNKDQYDLLAGKEITIAITFSVVADIAL